ncbi:MAG: hypothetical protein OIF32_05815 [Campylobacterales bacterium]|nr:hypothetical protein [Campylobacterales bacterium]
MNRKFLLLFLLLLFSINLYSANKSKKRLIKKNVQKKIPYYKYYGVVLGQGSLKRKITIKSNKSGGMICSSQHSQCNSEVMLGYANGDDYNLEEKNSVYKNNLIYGTQKGYTGNFYEFGLSHQEEVSEFIIQFGNTFPNLTFSKGWFIPFINTGVGLGYTGADSLNPTSTAFFLGLGGYTIFKKAKLRYGVQTTYRMWATIKHNYGDEDWIDNEVNPYIGLTYNF